MGVAIGWAGAARAGLWAMLVVWPWAVQAQAASEPARPVLRFAVGQSWASPLIELRDGRPVAGLMFELMEAIADAAGARPRYVLLPSKRVDAALDEGEVDMHCLISPAWLDVPLPAERWGPPMVVLEDVLVAPARNHRPAPIELDKQQGLRVGTVLGYRYDKLDALFAAGRLTREDGLNQAQMLAKLASGRTEVGVVDRLVMAQYNRSHASADQLVALQTLSRTTTHCQLARQTALPAAQLRAALQRVVDSGALRRLLARYR